MAYKYDPVSKILVKTKDAKTLDGPTKLELIKENRYKYEQFEKKSNGYDKFRKLVAQNITLPWIKGSNWMGGISDSNYQRGLEKIAKIIGEDPESIFNKVDSEFVKQQNEVDKIQMKDNKTFDALPNWNYIMNDLRNIERHFDQARSNAWKDLGSVKRDIDKILENKDLPDDIRPMLIAEYDRLYKKIYG